jgi:SAM-dependent methyltransferase
MSPDHHLRSPDRQLVLGQNRQAWNMMAQSQHVLAKPASDDELAEPIKTVDGLGWLGGNIKGWHVLCLAAGGGRHGPLYAAAGAKVTVVDLSPGMLDLDRRIAAHKQLSIETIETSMDQLSMLADGQFDLVIHPVSTCYLPSLERLFPEVARVTRAGALYVSQHKQPTNLQASLETYTGQYVIQHAYYDPCPVPTASQPSRLREPETREYVHSWNSILGGICRSGFVIEDVAEPFHAQEGQRPGSFEHRCNFIAPYIRIKARRSKGTGISNILVE